MSWGKLHGQSASTITADRWKRSVCFVNIGLLLHTCLFYTAVSCVSYCTHSCDTNLDLKFCNRLPCNPAHGIDACGDIPNSECKADCDGESAPSVIDKKDESFPVKWVLLACIGSVVLLTCACTIWCNRHYFLRYYCVEKDVDESQMLEAGKAAAMGDYKARDAYVNGEGSLALEEEKETFAEALADRLEQEKYRDLAEAYWRGTAQHGDHSAEVDELSDTKHRMKEVNSGHVHNLPHHHHHHGHKGKSPGSSPREGRPKSKSPSSSPREGRRSKHKEHNSGIQWEAASKAQEGSSEHHRHHGVHQPKEALTEDNDLDSQQRHHGHHGAPKSDDQHEDGPQEPPEEHKSHHTAHHHAPHHHGKHHGHHDEAKQEEPAAVDQNVQTRAAELEASRDELERATAAASAAAVAAASAAASAASAAAAAAAVATTSAASPPASSPSAAPSPLERQEPSSSATTAKPSHEHQHTHHEFTPGPDLPAGRRSKAVWEDPGLASISGEEKEVCPPLVSNSPRSISRHEGDAGRHGHATHAVHAHPHKHRAHDEPKQPIVHGGKELHGCCSSGS